MGQRLTRVLGGDDTRRLRDRVRERMARGLPLTGTISLSRVSAAERAAVDQLLGRRASTGASVTVPLDQLDRLLRSSGIWPEGLASAIVTLTGPVVIRSAAAAAVEEDWGHALEPLAALVARRPELAEWLSGLSSSGVLRRLARTPDAARPLITQTCAVLDRLPVESEQLGRFATRVLGGAHALDDGRPLTTLVLGAAKEIGGAPDGSGAAWRRMVWASVGLLLDELSSTVLTIGLPGDSVTGTGRVLTACRDTGQPVILTLRQLLTDPPQFDIGTVVYACENRSLVAAAAERLGARSAPLVCVSGQPGAAVLLLLTRLTESGARLRYHGDFDWYGIKIANFLRLQCAWEPWRFGAADYLAAAAIHAGNDCVGASATPSWDTELGTAMSRVGTQIEEEVVFDDLLGDLTTR